MENKYMSGRQQQQSSPRLLGSSSGNSSIPTLTLPQNVSRSCTTTPNNSQRFTTPRRSKSTVKSRTNKNHEEEKVHALKQKKGGQEDIIGQQGTNNLGLNTSFAKLQRGCSSPSPSPRPRISVSVPPPPSPSAWALSPGRSLPRKVTPDPPSAAPSTRAARIKSSGGGVGGVLKYFRLQKKVPPIQEEDFHRFRILHNRLLQWRFANARAEAAKLATQKISQTDVASVYEAITAAMAAMEGNLGMVSKLLPQLEKVLYMVTELLIAQKQQRDLESNLALVSALAEEEASVRAHLIQLESMHLLPPSSYKLFNEKAIFYLDDP